MHLYPALALFIMYSEWIKCNIKPFVRALQLQSDEENKELNHSEKKKNNNNEQSIKI